MEETIAIYLELLAAKARQLAEDYRKGRLWDGELDRGIGEIGQNLQKTPRERGL